MTTATTATASVTAAATTASVAAPSAATATSVASSAPAALLGPGDIDLDLLPEHRHAVHLLRRVRGVIAVVVGDKRIPKHHA